MVTYRPYQLELLERIYQSIQTGHKRILVVLPTGGGKSVLIGGLINHTTLNYGFTNNLILYPFNSLEVQLSATLKSMGAESELMTYHGALNSLGTIPPQDLLIFDEAHHIMGQEWRKIPAGIGHQLICGFTATPYRADDCPLLEKYGGLFDDLIVGPDLQALMAEGYLANIEYYSYPMVKTTEVTPIYIGDEHVGSWEKVYYKPENKENEIVKEYTDNFNGMTAIVFCKTIEHAKNVADKFNASGIVAAQVNCHQAKSEVKETLSRFKNGYITVLAACNMLSEGLDVPHAKLGIMARPITKSLAMYLQQIGRLLRPHNNETAKILDLVSNVHKFNLPQYAYQKEII